MRRKSGALLPIEQGILSALAALHRRGIAQSHGYQIAQYLRDLSDAKNLTAYGTLYRALGRLTEMGLLESRWEDARAAVQESRPVRRLYALTSTGTAAARDVRTSPVSIAAGRRAAVRA